MRNENNNGKVFFNVPKIQEISVNLYKVTQVKKDYCLGHLRGFSSLKK